MSNNESATAKLLNRELTEAYLRERTTVVAAPKHVVEPNLRSVTIFRVESEWLALPTSALQEVADSTKVHRLPNRPKGSVQGLVNVRGELMLCVSLAAFLKIDGAKDSERSQPNRQRVMVCSLEDLRFAFLIDEVFGMHRFHFRGLSDVPSTLSRSSSRYSTGVFQWTDKTVGLLDDRLLFQGLAKSLA